MIDVPDLAADERRRKARRTALVLGLIALSFYVSFIVLSVLRSQR